MADSVAEIRHAIERLTQMVIDDQNAQRGWDAGYMAAQTITLGTAIPVMGQDSDLALEFSTGYDPTTGTTVTGFIFDFSAFDSSDELM